MLKKKTNGVWSSISTLKKKVNGAWSDCTLLKRKTNGSWIDIFFNKFSVISYRIDDGCVGYATAYTNSVKVYNYIEYGRNCYVTFAFGRFNAVAGDTMKLDFSYDLYPAATGYSSVYIAINCNIHENSQGGNSVTNGTIANEYVYYQRKIGNKQTFNFTFDKSYNNVGICVRLNSACTGTSYGSVTSQATISDVYLNGAKINFGTFMVRN